MSGRFVRASKYRHVFGRSTKKDQCYDNLRVSNNAWDTNLIKANPQYLAVNWEAGGGGAFAVIPLTERGKLPERIPLFRGHTATVLDTDWSPFDDSFVASGSDDGKVFLWKVPENFTTRPNVKPDDVTDVAPAAKLAGHTRKVGHVSFNPSAQNVLASSSGDYTIKIWDVGAASPKLTLKHGDIVQSISWSANGSLLATTCRDKKLRVWDSRQQKPAVETPGHTGAKNSRVVWLGELDRVATTGFSRMSDRQLGLWDIGAAREPLDGFQMLDQISGVCMPFWDDGTHILYLAGKGDGNIRYYEYDNDKFEYLSQYSSPDPQRGVAFMPKRGVNTHDNEITRAFKTVNDSYIEPISFIVPRRAEVFQGDVYPPTVGTKPAMSANDYFSGKEGVPPKISLESLYEGEPPQEVPANEIKPTQPPKPAPEPKAPEPSKTESAEAPKPAPVSATTARVAAAPPAGSMKDNQASIADMASKYADKDECSDSEDETSSFEEVPKPVERPTTTASAPRPEPAHSTESPTKTRDAPITVPMPSTQSIPASQPTPAAATATSEVAKPADQPTPATSTHRSTPSGGIAERASEGLKTHLQDIKAMLETQNRTILAQNEKLDALTKDVDALRLKGGGGNGVKAPQPSKEERIRMLESELEEARL